MKVKQKYNIVDDTSINWKNPQRGRVYDIQGLSPSLNTVSGGGQMPYIEVKNATKNGSIEIHNGGGDEYNTAGKQDAQRACD